MNNYLLDLIMNRTTPDIMLDDDAYQAIVVEYVGYLKSLLHGLHNGLLAASTVPSNEHYGVDRKMEVHSHEEIRKTIRDFEGVLNIEIIRCNPSVCYQVHIDGAAAISLMVMPESFAKSMDGSKVDYSTFTHGFMLYTYS